MFQPCAATHPRWVSRIWPMFIRRGTPCGLQHDVDRGAVGQERHVLDGQDLADHALVAVPAGELVAVLDLALLRHVDADQLVHARRQLGAVVLAVEHPDADDLAGLAVRHLQRGVADLAAPSHRRSRGAAAPPGSARSRPSGVTLPTRMSPSCTSAPMRMMPRSSRSASTSSETFGMSRVISSGPSLVSRASISCSSMWIEVSTSSWTMRWDRMIASS